MKPINNDFSKVSPFVIDKRIRNTVGVIKSIRKIKESLLIETSDSSQSVRLLKLKKFNNFEVEVSAHPTLNYSKGVITCHDLLNCTVEEIGQELRTQNVIDVRRISVLRNGLRVDSASLILTFSSPKLPDRIKAGFHSLPVRLYIPSPIRCFRCQKFGHTSIRCVNDALCSCGRAPHEGDPCSEPISCPNCGGNHSAKARFCPKYKEEAAIQHLKVTERVSYIEARQRLNISTTKKTFAQATASHTLSVEALVADLVPAIVRALKEEKVFAKSDEFPKALSQESRGDEPVKKSSLIPPSKPVEDAIDKSVNAQTLANAFYDIANDMVCARTSRYSNSSRPLASKVRSTSRPSEDIPPAKRRTPRQLAQASLVLTGCSAESPGGYDGASDIFSLSGQESEEASATEKEENRQTLSKIKCNQ